MLEVLEQDQPTLLIVDDERVNRTMLAEPGQQYRVLLAKDGHSALTIASREAHRLMLILLDVSMPGMDGYEVLAQLRKADATAAIAIIFSSPVKARCCRPKKASTACALAQQTMSPNPFAPPW